MKKIAIAGLCNYENYGDQFIGQCVKFLVEKQENVQTKFVSFERKKEGITYYLNALFQKISKFMPKNIGYKLQYISWKLRMKKYFDKELKDVDGLIFAVGSFKWGTQNVWAMYSLCIECCEKRNIPVMFDAMNIQKYDDTNWKCKCLKKHANYSCVKMITSRDGEPGVKRLKEYYIYNKNIVLLPVGDPAFWIKECYRIEKKADSNIVGINLIRSDTFKNYGGKISNKKVVEMYVDVLKKLDEKDIHWEFFTNGLEKDLEIVSEIKKSYNKNFTIKIPKNHTDLVEIISNYREILGARLHACICSYSLDIPVCGFNWDEKLLHFSEEAGIESFFCSEQKFSGKEIFNNLMKVENYIFNSELKEKWKHATLNSIKKFILEYVSDNA